MEQSALERERTKLREVAALRSSLDGHELKFASIARLAADNLRALAASRR